MEPAKAPSNVSCANGANAKQVDEIRFNQKGYPSWQAVYERLLVLRKTSPAFWWDLTTIIIKRDKNKQVKFIKLICAGCKDSMSSGNPSKFWSTHRQCCPQKEEKVQGQLIDDEGVFTEQYQ
jgi:hypothetical protein